MIISESRKTIYIAFPHTGSTTIHDYCAGFDHLIIDDNALKHATVSQICDLGDYREYKFYMFVRNPIDWIKSKWSMMCRINLIGLKYIEKQNVKQWRDECLELYEKKPNFNEYANWFMFRHEKNNVSIFEYYIDQDCDITYLKFEDFETSCSVLFKALGIPKPLKYKRLNQTQNNNIKVDNDTEKKLKNFFQEEISKFYNME